MAPLVLLLLFLYLFDHLPCCFARHRQVQVEDEEPQQRHSQKPYCHRAYYYDHHRIYTRPCLRHSEDDQVNQERANAQHDARQERYEESIIAFTDAVVHKWAVMIEHLYAILAR